MHVANLLRDYRLELDEQPRITVNVNYGVPQVADLMARFEPLRAPSP